MRALAEQRDRVAAGRCPRRRVDPAEQLLRGLVPGPAEVGRQFGQGRQGLGEDRAHGESSEGAHPRTVLGRRPNPDIAGRATLRAADCRSSATSADRARTGSSAPTDLADRRGSGQPPAVRLRSCGAGRPLSLRAIGSVRSPRDSRAQARRCGGRPSRPRPLRPGLRWPAHRSHRRPRSRNRHRPDAGDRRRSRDRGRPASRQGRRRRARDRRRHGLPRRPRRGRRHRGADRPRWRRPHRRSHADGRTGHRPLQRDRAARSHRATGRSGSRPGATSTPPGATTRR